MSGGFIDNMAYITQITCKVCGKTKTEVRVEANRCNDCRKAAQDLQRRTTLASLKGLTIEERIIRMETLLYDLDIGHRLSVLESNFLTY